MNPVEGQDFGKINHRFEGIYGIYLELIGKPERFYTDRLDLETLGFWIDYAQDLLHGH
jgi:hypothetical protein